jgi:transcriptional regulator with XRE-family HTH domain
MAFKDILKRQRQAGGWTQESLAAAAGLTVHAIRDLEQGKRRPMLATAYKLACALEVSLDVLAADEEPPGPVRRRPK